MFTYPIARGMDEGVLAKVKYVQLRFRPVVSPSELKQDKEQAKNTDTGVIDKSLLQHNHLLGNVINHPEKRRVLRKLVRGWLSRDRYIVVLADRVSHVNLVADHLEDYDPQVVHGKIKRLIIDYYIDRFEKGINRLIVASGVFNKGISIKRIDAIINVGETEDANTIVQQIGRELRLHADKGTALFVDFAGSTGRSRETGQARLDAVRAAGIPTQVFTWEREPEAFWEAVRPPKITQ